MRNGRGEGATAREGPTQRPASEPCKSPRRLSEWFRLRVAVEDCRLREVGLAAMQGSARVRRPELVASWVGTTSRERRLQQMFDQAGKLRCRVGLSVTAASGACIKCVSDKGEASVLSVAASLGGTGGSELRDQTRNAWRSTARLFRVIYY
jgi:hypothetical protein